MVACAVEPLTHSPTGQSSGRHLVGTLQDARQLGLP